jgi:glucokinase
VYRTINITIKLYFRIYNWKNWGIITAVCYCSTIKSCRSINAGSRAAEEIDMYVIGVDIGGTTTSIGLVDRNGNLAGGMTLATQAQQPAQSLVTRLSGPIDSLLTSQPQPARLSGIGVGAPNANYHRGTIENPVNLDWGVSTNLAELFRQQYKVPVAVTNDAKAAAIGEMMFGGARGMNDFMVITLGTGLGSGIVVNGEVLYGVDGFAGELGHTVVNPEGRYCACGKQGCLETYVSATGICRTVFELLAERRDPSILRNVSFCQLTSKQIFEAAVENDAIALAAFDRTARILGMKLADAVAHTSPEAIFLSGGLAAAGEILLTPAKRYLDEFLFTPYKGKVQLLRSDLPVGNGAILGAAALAWHEVEKYP